MTGRDPLPANPHPPAHSIADDPTAVQCAHCGSRVSEIVSIAARWRHYAGTTGKLVLYCPKCAAREFESAN